MKTSPLMPYESQNKIRDILTKVGLSPREAEIFVCLCNIGPQPGSIIAKNVGMKRTTVYHSLQRLMEKGFVYPLKQTSITYFHLNSINEAISKIEHEKDQLKEKQFNLKKISSIIHRNSSLVGSISQMRYKEFQGPQELKRLKMSTLKGVKDLCIFSHPDENGHVFKANDEDFWLKYEQRITRGEINVRMIVPESPDVALKKPVNPLIDMKIVPRNLLPLSKMVEVNILPDKIVLIGNQFGVVIENQELATIKRSAFELAWIGAESL